MTQATVTKLVTRTQPKSKPKAVHTTRRYERQNLAAGAVTGVAGVLTVLSLNHLAHGIELATRCPTWESWAMALGVDLGFMSFELVLLTAATEAVRRDAAVWAEPAIKVLMVASALINAYAFVHQSDGWLQYPSGAIGASIPLMIFALMRVSGILWLGSSRKR